MTKLTTDTKKTICIRECSLPVSENAAYLYQRIQPTCIREYSLPVSENTAHLYQRIQPTCIRECSLSVSENAAYLYQRIQPTCIRECSLPVSDIAVNWMMALHSFYGICWRIYKPPDFPSDVNIYSFHFSF